MPNSADAIVSTLLSASFAAKAATEPYPYWFLENCLPESVIDGIADLPFPAPDLGDVSGTREAHNGTRKYFDAENQNKFGVCKSFCDAFQDKRVTDHIESFFGTDLSGTYLRVEYAQDTGGFWLEPHSDLGVKTFTMLLYVSKNKVHADLGTDIYDADKSHVGRSPFRSNGAMVFVPSGITFHGFEPRPIEGVRKSVIVNYVTNEWRAREQLAFPEQPIA